MHSHVRTGLAVTLATAAAAVCAAPAGASVQLFPSASPLPGSTFQGGDGNQTPANSTTKLDWKDFKNDPDLKTLVDPSNPDKEFGGGSSEDKPDTWSFNYPAESTPLKANFRVAWDLFKGDPGRLLQLAFRRAENGGNAFLAFELNQDPRMWTNSVGTSIPCRTTGDLLITYNVANSDATQIYLTVQKWTSSTAKSGYLTGFEVWALGENIGWGSGALGTPKEMMTALMNSPGHRRNLLSTRYRNMGVGVSTGIPIGGRFGATYVQQFGWRSR